MTPKWKLLMRTHQCQQCVLCGILRPASRVRQEKSYPLWVCLHLKRNVLLARTVQADPEWMALFLSGLCDGSGKMNEHPLHAIRMYLNTSDMHMSIT